MDLRGGILALNHSAQWKGAANSEFPQMSFVTPGVSFWIPTTCWFQTFSQTVSTLGYREVDVLEEGAGPRRTLHNLYCENTCTAGGRDHFLMITASDS